jgi:hypothetical protein
VGLSEASIMLRLKVAEVSGWGVMLTIPSLLQTLPTFSNGLFMLKSTYFSTHYVIVVLQSINIFGEKFCDRHIGIIDGTGTGKHECTLGPERRCYGFPENRFVREI